MATGKVSGAVDNTAKELETPVERVSSSAVDGTYFHTPGGSTTITYLEATTIGKIVCMNVTLKITGQLVSDYAYTVLRTGFKPYLALRIPAVGYASGEEGQVVGTVTITAAGLIQFAPNTAQASGSKEFRFSVTYIYHL